MICKIVYSLPFRRFTTDLGVLGLTQQQTLVKREFMGLREPAMNYTLTAVYN